MYVSYNKDSFNFLSLSCRRYHSITTKPNKVALIKKNAIHNNLNPSTQKYHTSKLFSQKSISLWQPSKPDGQTENFVDN